MSGVDNPGLIGIEYCGENYCIVNFKLNRKVEINAPRFSMEVFHRQHIVWQLFC